MREVRVEALALGRVAWPVPSVPDFGITVGDAYNDTFEIVWVDSPAPAVLNLPREVVRIGVITSKLVRLTRPGPAGLDVCVRLCDVRYDVFSINEGVETVPLGLERLFPVFQ